VQEVTLEGLASTGKPERRRTDMALRFLAIDPDTNGLNCPALFLEEETGDLLFQGEAVTDPEMLAESREHSARGVIFRRARVVSEPLAEYIRFEYDSTAFNVAAGEQVRWLPRHTAPSLLVPLCDFWVLDDRIVRFGYFAGDGEFLGDDMAAEADIARDCAGAFERVWERAIPHADYRPA
jgi:hypothetical protein